MIQKWFIHDLEIRHDYTWFRNGFYMIQIYLLYIIYRSQKWFILEFRIIYYMLYIEVRNGLYDLEFRNGLYMIQKLDMIIHDLEMVFT